MHFLQELRSLCFPPPLNTCRRKFCLHHHLTPPSFSRQPSSDSVFLTNRQSLNQLHNRKSGVPPNFAFPMLSMSSTTSSFRLLLLLPAVRDCSKDQLLHTEGIRTIVRSDIAHYGYYCSLCSLFIQFSDIV